MSDQASEAKSAEEVMKARAEVQKQAWRTFQRERSRLLAEGHKGSFAVVRGEEVIGVYPDEDAGLRAGYERFGVGVGFIVMPIVPEEEERIYRVHPYSRTWQS
jgi:hypothetical protein